MSLKYRDRNGVTTVLAGLTPGGNLEAGAVATREGTFAVSALSANGYETVSVTFTDPLPDADYEIVIDGQNSKLTYNTFGKTVNGFTVTVSNNSNDSQGSVTAHYKAFKLYEVAHAEQNASDIADIKAKIPSTASSSNKLATAKDVSDLTSAVNERLDNLEDAVPVDASITNQLVTTSAMNTALGGKQDTLTFDTTPTEDSSNPVTSDGIYDALATKAAQTEVNDIVNIYGAKNVLPVSTITQTAFNGVTITNYNNGTYLLNGTCTADASFSLHSVTESDFLTKVGKASYVLSGYPSISGNTGRIVFQYRKADDSGWAEAYTDNGQGVTLPYDGTKTKYTIYLLIKSGDSFSNVTFKPMIRLASIKDATYEPYTLTNQQITPYAESISNYNLLDNAWFTVNQRGKETYTNLWSYCFDRWMNFNLDSVARNNDGSITVSSADTTKNNRAISQYINNPEWLNGKTVTLSIMDTNGRVYSKTGIVKLNGGYNFIACYIPDTISFTLNSTASNDLQARVWLFTTVTSASFRAVKLELGAASTLGHDGIPNYQAELVRCRTNGYGAASTVDYYTNQGNISVGTPNPNLLDNPWFTVNQREFDNASGGGTDSYRFDRWRGTYGYDTTNNIPAFTGVQYAIQRLESSVKNFLNGKLLTASVMYSDGTIESGTFTYYKQPSDWITVSNITKVYVQIGYNATASNVLNGSFCITNKNTDLSIKAVKLELGTASTLANDIEPNYQQELAKCQRYFYRLNLQQYTSIAFGIANTDTSYVAVFTLPTTMRIKPTVTCSDVTKLLLRHGSTQLINTVTQLMAYGNNARILTFVISATGITVGDIYELYYSSNDDYIDFSADL